MRKGTITPENSLKHLWMEVNGKNKESPYSNGVTCFKNAKKIEWIEKWKQLYLRL